MDNKIKNILKTNANRRFVNFYKNKRGWVYYFTDVFDVHSEYKDSEQERSWKKEGDDDYYKVSSLLYKEIGNSQKYNDIKKIGQKNEDNPVGFIFSSVYSSLIDLISKDKLAFLILIKTHISIAQTATSEERLEFIFKMEELINENKLYVNLEDFVGGKVNTLIDKDNKKIILAIKKLI